MKKKLSSRNKISRAALELFTEKGINSTTTKEIARKAGVAEGTIYIYFKSKDELAYSLFVEHMNNFRQYLEDSIGDTTDPIESMERLVETFYSFAKDEPVEYKYIVIGHHTELKKMPALKSKPKDTFVKTIKKGIKKGIFRKIDPNIAASYVIGMITRSVMFYNSGLIKCNYRRLISETKDSVKRVLYG